MKQTELLNELARLKNIEPEYTDFWSRRRQVPTETLRAILSAMDIDCSSNEAVSTALEEARQALWQRVLPPVVVRRPERDGVALDITLPANRSQQDLSWRLEHENGSRDQQPLNFTDLPLSAEHKEGKAEFQRRTLSLPDGIAYGYHRFAVVDEDDRELASCRLIVTPGKCYRPDAVNNDRRIWGIETQLYSIRSRHSWGIGDFSDLVQLVDNAAALGADAIGLNPLHGQFPFNPEAANPFRPSTRCFLNVAYLDVEAADEFGHCEAAQEAWHTPEFQQWLHRLRSRSHVDWGGVIAAKMQILEHLYQCFRDVHLPRNTPRAQAFQQFRNEGGHVLWQHAVFEALQEDLLRQNADYIGWANWPACYQKPDSDEVKEFAQAHADRVSFYIYLQWLADQQLSDVGKRCLELQRGVGLYQCLAVASDPGGSDVWRNQSLYAMDMGVGSPPDTVNTFGQQWGVPPMRPDCIERTGYQSVIEFLRLNMKHCGALRLSHVMSLLRLFWIPRYSESEEGAYVYYDVDAMLGIVALESQRQQCMVVGEDLGMVPDEMREKLHEYGILTQQMLYFEKTDEVTFKPPEDYYHDSVVAVNNHDLPTLEGFWRGLDLKVRNELDLFPSPEIRQREITRRASDRAALLLALEKHDLLPEGLTPDPAQIPEMTPELAIAIHHYLALAPSRMFMVQLENLISHHPQANLPGTIDSYPNWRIRLQIELEELLEQPMVWQVAEVLKSTHRARPLLPKQESSAPLSLEAVPNASYRFQLNPDFTFFQAAEQIDYLNELGISHVYCSPILAARSGSTHGYDVTDHSHINPEMGGEDGFTWMSDKITDHGMKTIVDIVPNHMVVMGHENTWWLDVLENGAASLYADYFDIDWNPVKELSGKVLVPVLGGPYGGVLNNGELLLKFNEKKGEFGVWYYEHLFPIDPKTYSDILTYRVEALVAQLGTTDPQLAEFKSLMAAFEHLPDRQQLDLASKEERNRDKQINKQRLAQLCDRSSAIHDFIQANVRAFNEGGEDDHLHPLLEKQAYRLAFWRTAAEEINYRRFFDINELAGIRMENPKVFEETHRLMFELIEQKKVHGLRIDHADGLNDPAGYFNWLSRGLSSPLRKRQIYIVAEKILAAYETLPDDWEIDGSTGYDAMSMINGLFVDAKNEDRFSELYQEFLGQEMDFEDLVYFNKRRIMRSALASELNVLANRLNQIAESNPMTRDFTLNSLRDALMEITSCFPVYRTYVAHDKASESDHHYMDWAVAQAKKRTGMSDLSVFDFVHDALLLKLNHSDAPAWRDALKAFAMSVQQFTSPVMAKGVEDTTFYVYNRLVSLNEVGSEPSRFGSSVGAFHHVNQNRLQRWPYNMLCSTTHDTKRSEDTRARLNVISEIPEQWHEHLRRWHRINSRLIHEVDDKPAPSRNDEYLLYQTLLSSWPFAGLQSEQDVATYAERIRGYMLKAVREAKVRTSWLNNNEAYENALSTFVDELIAGQNNNMFMDDFLPFQQKVARLGIFNSLAQTVLKLTMPGAPDIYQGTELWDFSLVDPDNRRPVDYSLRRQLLGEIKDKLKDTPPWEVAPKLLEDYPSGAVKLFTLWRLLSYRSQHWDIFKRGDYHAVETSGDKADHLCAFHRHHQQDDLLVVVPRLIVSLTEDGEKAPVGATWQDSALILPESLHGAKWRNQLTDETISDKKGELSVSQLLENFPVAVLVRES